MLNKTFATSILLIILAAAAISAQTIQCECPPFDCPSGQICCNSESPPVLGSCVLVLPHGPNMASFGCEEQYTICGDREWHRLSLLYQVSAYNESVRNGSS
ncbi:hypothetical protein B0H19DRAFT_1066497 [Mycena capillaripes]|nr:hypothetical protein B0H19DRAFT_1066497 [Mycena capillaripes]